MAGSGQPRRSAATSDSMCPARWWTATNGRPAAAAIAFGERHADQERFPPGRGPLRNGDRPHVRRQVDSGLGGARASTTPADIANVLARGELRHDAAPLTVDGDLGRRPHSRRIAHGAAASPVSSMTAADVSSQEVSMPQDLHQCEKTVWLNGRTEGQRRSAFTFRLSCNSAVRPCSKALFRDSV